ncbi:MAG TPA: hypothetical protein VF450_16095 [Noviherbaspirillum sp.]
MIAPRLRKAALASSGFILLATLVIGWMHTRSARPLLSALGVHCPVDEVSTAQVEKMRKAGLAGLRGDMAAPARPAVASMVLEHTTERDAQAWASEKGAACESIVRGYRFLRCRGVSAKALGIEGPAVSELWLSFGTDGKLIGVDIYRRGLDAAGVAQAWSSAVDKLEETLGKPPVAFGDASPEALQSAAIQTARVQYKYADYIATVTAANLPHSGLAVREQYMVANM